MSAIWRRLDNPKLGLMTHLDSAISTAEIQTPGLLPDLRSTDTILVLSDYGGEHNGASHKVLSFLLLDPSSLGGWDESWQPTRQRALKDGRRMSFKGLNDKQRSEALFSFLTSCTQLNGLVFSLAINRSIKDLFDSPTKDPDPSLVPIIERWKVGPFEKLVLSVQTVSLLLAGLSRPGQDVLWITDEDAIAANQDRLTDACMVMDNVSGHILPHDLRHFRFGTAERSDDGTKRVEDLLAVPDLVSGFLVDLLSNYHRQGLRFSPDIVLGIPDSLQAKSRFIGHWFACPCGNLRKLVYLIDPVKGSPRIRVLRFEINGAPSS
jgi:hypothetical protein